MVRKDLWEELFVGPMNKKQMMMMEMANGAKEVMEGCTEFLEIKVDGMKTWAYAYVTPMHRSDFSWGDHGRRVYC